MIKKKQIKCVFNSEQNICVVIDKLVVTKVIIEFVKFVFDFLIFL